MNVDHADFNGLRFEPLRAQHASELFNVLLDHELYEFIDERPPHSVESLVRRYRALESRRSPDGSQLWLNWVVRAPPEHRAIGYVQATVQGREAHIGYLIAKDYWGKGFATVAVAWLIHQLSSIGVDKIVATVEERNQRSMRVLEKLGFLITQRRGTEIVFECAPQARPTPD
jgi:RimJ/RimL family protein N-acetyltransferase